MCIMKKLYILLTMALSFAACTYEIDDVFDKSSAERISEEMARTKELLQSGSNGWLMYYYGSTQYGGYNVLCKFDKDEVTVQSEIYGPKTVTSHYKIEQSQGVLLSFDEYNEVFHFFSDPANPAGVGINGKGMEGDFEFRVISAGPDEIILSGKKHGSKVVMKPVDLGCDWDLYLEDVLEMEENLSSGFYSLEFGETSVTASATYRRLVFYDEASDSNIYVPFCFTDKGMKLYSTLTYGGVSVDEFIYSEEDDKCYSADNAASLQTKAVPLSQSIMLNDWFFSAEGASEKVLNAFNTCKAGSASEGEVIAYWYLGRKNDESPYGLVFYSGDFSSGFYVGTFSLAGTAVDDDTITFSVTAADSNASYYQSYCGYGTFVNMLNATFKLSTDNPRNPSYIRMENASDPSIWMNVYADEILLPFGE